MPITNQQAAERAYLKPLYEDDYYPDHVLDKGKAILLRLCERIEAEQPTDLPALYVLTHAATEEFNDLEVEFDKAGSEIETVAREEIAEDFWFIANAYGFTDADHEELIATRDW
ncbi:DUF5713 family protein [Yinghuangia soli]|uniref:DUF5713 family protein n=1 Tax=Yinghuangia soli TaxID=2908204 RepID=A0AA41PZI9_9ACTN|nr:DUF5713 family protein [Yinghuangia soli]MCF2527322.1 DUF5713 family protein [Yinghuangia soli]